MQVYRGLDVGTAKPTRAERQRIRYWGLDLISPQELFSVGDYRRAALRAIAATTAAKRHLIVVGGSGLYLKSLTHGLALLPPRNEPLRLQAERMLVEQGIEALQAWLVRLDSIRYQKLVDRRNPRRLIRAIEIAASGAPGADKTWLAAQNKFRIPGLRLPQEELNLAIENRVCQMYARGLIAEVQRLRSEGLTTAPTAARAIGYAEALSYLAGRCTREEAIAATILHTRQLAKRQMTWFRNQANVDWLSIKADMPLAERGHLVLEHWRMHGPTPIVGY